MVDFLMRVTLAAFSLAIVSQFFGLSFVLFFSQVGYSALIATVFAFVIESFF